MKNYNNKLIKLDDGNKYIVVKQINYENNIYLHLLNRENGLDVMFVKVDGDNITTIEPNLFKDKLLPLFFSED